MEHIHLSRGSCIVPFSFKISHTNFAIFVNTHKSFKIEGREILLMNPNSPIVSKKTILFRYEQTGQCCHGIKVLILNAIEQNLQEYSYLCEIKPYKEERKS